jgi:hypothetical protein
MNFREGDGGRRSWPLSGLQTLREHFDVAIETGTDIKAPRLVIGAQHTYPQLASAFLDGKSLNRVEERSAISAPAKWLQDDQVTDQRVLARGVVEFFKGHSRENGCESRDLVAAFSDKNSSGIDATSIEHLRKVLRSHRGAGPKARIDPPLVLVQLDDASPNSSGVSVPVFPDLCLLIHWSGGRVARSSHASARRNRNPMTGTDI